MQSKALKKIIKNPTAMVCIALLLVIIFACTFCKVLAPYGFDDQELANRLQGPSAAHIFGTDEYGRDVFSRVLYGGQNSIVIGFAAVGVFAALLIFSYAQFVMANDAVVTLRNDLKTLQAENVTLSARYEQVFDMERIQAAVGDTMVRPTEEQIVYLDLSEPDSVVLYGEEETASGIQGALQGFKNIVHELTEYFR